MVNVFHQLHLQAHHRHQQAVWQMEQFVDLGELMEVIMIVRLVVTVPMFQQMV